MNPQNKTPELKDKSCTPLWQSFLWNHWAFCLVGLAELGNLGLDYCKVREKVHFEMGEGFVSFV